jgi:heavy metal translocating P-type ATPase
MSTPATTELHVTGMTCNNCARKVTNAAQNVPGVHSVSVNVAAAHASVRWSAGTDKDVTAVLTAISQAGFAANELSPAVGEVRQSRWQWNLIVGLSVTGVLMVGEWGFGLALTPWFQWLAFALAAGVQLFCGAQFYAGAWRQLKVGQSNMDALVALGSTTAFGYSTWALLTGVAGHVYFMEAAAIISLISFGHWLEARVSDQASDALKSLLELAPQTARKLAPAQEPSGRSAGHGPGQMASRPLLRAETVLGASVQGEGTPAARLKQFTIAGSKPALDSLPPFSGGAARAEGRSGLKAFAFSASESGKRKAEVETEVPVSELRIGDRVALRPGDRVPVDGVVHEGESAVDEAMLTGESAPADKQAGSELFAGTVNLNGRLVLRVTATGDATALAHIIGAVQRAQTSRADIQRLGDRISNVFVPVIVVLALAAGLWWGLAPGSASRVHEFLTAFLWQVHAPAGVAAGFIIAAAVLIIACPCAMGLATPAAIMASANAAARLGILIRDGVALEKAGRITAVIFDKTGTLTMGRPEVAETWQRSAGVPLAAPLALALVRHSTHPISRAVAAYCETRAGVAQPEAGNTAVNDWREIRGCGIEAKSSMGHRPAASAELAEQPGLPILRLGSLRWLRERAVALVAGEKFVAEWTGQGATVVGLAAGTELLALFAVRDTLKPGSAKVVAQLQRQNLKTYLLTGDNAQTAAAIAKLAGLAPENVFAEVRPEQKAEFVKRLQTQGERVAFVGDGINDAPALTQADLGIAVSRASDVAREAADIILLKSEIEAVPEALGLARATLRTIKQNLFWAFFYNALGVPLAALGFISPVFCAAAMGVSDLIVIGNALRLLRWRNPLK